MTPTQYQSICDQLAEIKAGQVALRHEVQDALVQQARHDEQIKVLQKGTGGAITLALGVLLAWLKTNLHL